MSSCLLKAAEDVDVDPEVDVSAAGLLGGGLGSETFICATSAVTESTLDSAANTRNACRSTN